MNIKCDLDIGKKLMLEILDYIEGLCEENELEYFITAGTLLGAVRHEGFIPWDDDIDIFMTKEDKAKLIELVLNDKNTDFGVLDKSLDEKYPLELTKIVMKGTSCELVEELKSVATKSEIFVDIFTLDYFDKEVSKTPRTLVRLFENARKKSVIDGLAPGAFKNSLKVFRVVSNVVVPFNLIKLYKKYNVVDQGKFVGFAVEEASDLICCYDDIYPLKRMKFEDREVWGPNKPTNILAREYGPNYMELPPVEKRTKHSEAIYINEDVAKRYNINIERK